MSGKLVEVSVLYAARCRSIPDMLREAADSIESETDEHDRTKAMVAVQVTETGEAAVYGWGETDDIHALGCLQLGIFSLTGNMRGEE